jgi:putative membrane protein
MSSTLFDSLPGLFDFGRYFVASLVILILFCLIYCKITPYNEFKLIKEGNTSVAISFGGALIGFVLPLHSAITHSVGYIDMLIWATIAMFVQLAVFSSVRIILKSLVIDIENNHIAAATLLAFCSVAIGILNAACITY